MTRTNPLNSPSKALWLLRLLAVFSLLLISLLVFPQDVLAAVASTSTVGGTVSGLSGTVVLQDNGGDDLSVSANGSFTFATALASGAAYSVTVKTNPSGQSCSVASGSGTIASANVTNVAVSCTNSARYSVGGTVSGLSGTVVLQDNGGDDLSVSANGSFTFATALASGAAYSVTVKTNPSGQSCSVASGSGTIASANVTNVAVSCTNSARYSVGGTVSGLSGTVVLQDNGGDDLSVSANGSFTFATALASGAAYSVTVKTNPSGQSCSVASGSGTIASANVTNVAVSCAATSATGSDNFNRADGSLGAGWAAISDGALVISSQVVAGTASAGVSGDIRTAEAYTSDQYSQVEVTSTQLTGGQWIGPMVRAQNGGLNAYVGLYSWKNGSPVLQLFKRSGANSWTQLGSTYSSGPLAAGTQLKVTAVGSTISFLLNGAVRITATDTSLSGGAPGIMSYGTGRVDNWAGAALGGGGGTTFTVGGTVSGLSGTVVLQDNGGDDLSVSANGSFTFATALASGAAYSVTVKTNPSGQSCSVASGSGTIASANVTNVAVSCAATSATGSDNFNRADGSLGAGWAAISDGALVISSQVVAGTASAGVSGDIRTAEAYTSDQYSQVEVTSTQLTGGQWIGPMVRAQNGGLNAYVGLYSWKNGSPVLQLFKRSGANSWTQLGSTYSSGPLAAGTQLKVTAVGSTISFLLNGAVRITATDTSLSGGAPGIMSYGTGRVDNWAGAALGGGGGTTFTVGGTVSGLSGTVVLQDNGGDDLSVSANGSFTFATALASGAAYSVTVKTNPSGQSCSVASGSGTIASANVTNVAVSCTNSARYSVGGTVSGLSGTVVLQDNGGDDLSVSANGSFTFATALASGAAYSVTVKTNPSGQTCSVASGSGTIASANVTNVAVSCAATSATGSDNFNRADGSLGAGWTDYQRWRAGDLVAGGGGDRQRGGLW